MSFKILFRFFVFKNPLAAFQPSAEIFCNDFIVFPFSFWRTKNKCVEKGQIHMNEKSKEIRTGAFVTTMTLSKVRSEWLPRRKNETGFRRTQCVFIETLVEKIRLENSCSWIWSQITILKKSIGLQSLTDKHDFIDNNRAGHSVSTLCRILDVSKSDYYAAKNRQKGKREESNQKLLGSSACMKNIPQWVWIHSITFWKISIWKLTLQIPFGSLLTFPLKKIGFTMRPLHQKSSRLCFFGQDKFWTCLSGFEYGCFASQTEVKFNFSFGSRSTPQTAICWKNIRQHDTTMPSVKIFSVVCSPHSWLA